MNQEQSLRRFVAMLRRRRYSVGGVALAVLALGLAVVLRLPAEYQAQAVVRMDDTTLPKEYVPPTATEAVAERLKAIRLELLERSLVTEAGRSAGALPARGRVGALFDDFRSRFDVKVEGEDTFVLLYRDRTPGRAAAVVNELTRLFSTEHELRIQAQSSRTKTLFDQQVGQLRDQLAGLQRKVDEFESAHDGALPEQLDGNLRTLDQLQADIDANQQSLDMAEDRKRALESQQLDYLRHQENVLADAFHLAQTRYADDQPEVVNARREYEAVKADRISEEQAIQKGLATSPALQEAQRQIDRARGTLKDLRAQQAEVRQAVAATAANAEQLAKLTLDRDATRQEYQAAMAKDDDAHLAALEESQVVGPDRITVLEDAAVPVGPISPNRILLAALVLGAALCLGLGAGLLHDALDTSLHDPEELRSLDPRLRLLACVPHTAAATMTPDRAHRS